MKLVIGLGNPGDEHKGTRHNIGFIMLDAYALYMSARNDMIRTYRKIDVKRTDLAILLKPQDFMNNSGWAVQEIRNKMGIENKDILVIHDEMDFSFNTIKLKAHTKDTKHNGVRSVAQCIGTDFSRIRIGIGRPTNDQTEYQFVLDNFSLGEGKCMGDISSKVIEIINDFIILGIQPTMNKYNKI